MVKPPRIDRNDELLMMQAFEEDIGVEKCPPSGKRFKERDLRSYTTKQAKRQTNAVYSARNRQWRGEMRTR